ncbi:hypothetical protein FBUS_07318 [Fasciolopsis buskii]|uniref:RRM domain-containing protein n=1 Tax=Fasciolopsis buskii TaxID=27845 RepID=A0A8E0RQF8_9TREM|nr:hypothetical protein FBUS_07318 [Fasciolopsis buski]
MKAARGHAVLRISCLPKYFTEREIAGYLKQFGDIGSIFMPRSPKTLKCKGYAFVEVPKVIATIVSSTLDGVLNFNKIMKCEILPDARRSTFRRRFPVQSTRIISAKRQRNAALRRIQRATQTHSAEGGKTGKSGALRRRTRSLTKRLLALQRAHPEFQFKASG